MPSIADVLIARMMEACPPEEITAFSAKDQAEADRIMKETSSDGV